MCKNYADGYKVRFHRGGLHESMETCFEPKDWQDFINHVKQENKDIIQKSIRCELYVETPDDRIGWEQTWMITARFKNEGSFEYPIGFSNRDIMELHPALRTYAKKFRGEIND